MKILTINIESLNQETELRQLLDEKHVQYEIENETDETSYLLSSPANAAHLKQALEEHTRGEGVKISLDEIWK